MPVLSLNRIPISVTYLAALVVMSMSSVSAHSGEWYENAGYLSKQSFDKTAIAPEDRIPGVIAATWYDVSNSIFVGKLK